MCDKHTTGETITTKAVVSRFLFPTVKTNLEVRNMFEGSIWLWIGFNLFVLALLALDLGVFHQKAHKVSIKEATIWSVVWITLSMLFNLGIYFFWDNWHRQWYTTATALALQYLLKNHSVLTI
jgi:hypothetical protein